jgi:hypothetical protein
MRHGFGLWLFGHAVIGQAVRWCNFQVGVLPELHLLSGRILL